MKKNFFKSKKTIKNIPKLKADVFKIDKDIRFITIIDYKGNLLDSQHREGINSILNKKESKKSLKQIIQFWKDNKILLKKFGHAKFAIVEYEKIKRIIIYLNEKELLYISAEPNCNHKKIISKIQNLDILTNS